MLGEKDIGNRNTFSIYGSMLEIMDKLSNFDYLDRILDKKINDDNFVIYEIEKIYSYIYNDKQSKYNIICDSKDLTSSLNYNKADIVLKKVQYRDDLDKYLKNQSLNIEVQQEEKYENSAVYRERNKSLIQISVISILMILIVFLILLIILNI